MLEISYDERADLESIYPDEDRAPLIETTQSDQAGRYAEILWLEQKLIGPLRPHKEDRLRKALANTEAVSEAQWIELEMAVGPSAAFKVRRRVEAPQERPMGACDKTCLGTSSQVNFFDQQYVPSTISSPVLNDGVQNAASRKTQGGFFPATSCRSRTHSAISSV